MYLLLYLLVINLIGFTIMGLDKRKAQRNEWRISEKTLWIVALFGGALGTTVGMQVFRHKTKHLTFKIGFPALLLVWIILLYYLYSNTELLPL